MGATDHHSEEEAGDYCDHEARVQLRLLDVDLGNTTPSKLVFKKTPYQQWFLGVLFLLIGLTWLFYILFESDNPKGFLFVPYKEERPKPGLWHYITSSLVILLGLLVIFTG